MVTLFVNGLASSVTATDVRDLLSPFGEVEIALPPDRIHGRPHRGFGFAKFANADAAGQAMKDLDGVTWHGGRVLRLEFARPLLIGPARRARCAVHRGR